MTPEEIVERAAEVLRDHRTGPNAFGHVVCACLSWRDRAPSSVTEDNHRAHVAAELAEAGLLLTPEREQEIRYDEREKRAGVIRPLDRGAAAAVLFLSEPRPLTEAEIQRGQEIARLIAEEAGR